MAVLFVLSSGIAFEGCGFHATNGPDGACYDSRKMGEGPMDSLEQRDPATEEPVEQTLDRECPLSIVGLSLVKAFEVLVGPDGPAESLADGYRQAFHRFRAEGAYEEPLFPSAADLLAELSVRD